MMRFFGFSGGSFFPAKLSPMLKGPDRDIACFPKIFHAALKTGYKTGYFVGRRGEDGADQRPRAPGAKCFYLFCYPCRK